MQQLFYARACSLSSVILAATLQFAPALCAAQGTVGGQAGSTLRDGQHDFDFNLGTWKTHIRRLLNPLSGSTSWTEMEGTVEVTPIWGGRAQMEQIEATASSGSFEGLTIFLYNRESHQWSQTFANSSNGTLNVPAIGEFRDGRGELYDQEVYRGRAILVRAVWSGITRNTHHFEQSFSADGGKTWEPNFVAELTRMEGGSRARVPSGASKSINHDFDFNFGTWKTHISRLQHPLTGSDQWSEYDGKSIVHEVWGGRASLLELEADGPSGHIEGVGLRLYNPQSHQWSLNWTNSADASMAQPMLGEFKDGRGEFFDQETYNGRGIFVRNGFQNITKDSSRFEQAFSPDGGKTWETNWVMEFVREDSGN